MEDAGKRSCKLKKQLKEKNKGFTESKKINTAKEILSDETKNIASVNQTLSEINASKRFIRDKCHNRERLKFRQQKELKCKNNISIHKRLSQALSCLTFIIIGIPLGIKLRSGHLMIGFGASFIVILFLYYPLVVTGIVLAENAFMPVIPAIWGGNIILFTGGMFILRKLFIN